MELVQGDNRQLIEALQREIAAELGYEIVHHRMELYVRSKRADREAG